MFPKYQISAPKPAFLAKNMGFESLSMENVETSSAEAGCVNKKVPGAKKEAPGAG